MITEKWHPIHWAILAMGMVMILFMIQLNEYNTTHDQVQSPNNDTLIIKQSHEFNIDCDTIANENI